MRERETEMTPTELADELIRISDSLSMGFVSRALKNRHALIESAILIDRWQSGNFTPEEIHNFCHKLPETVSRCEFNKWCQEYQDKLYGKSEVPEWAE